MSLYIFRGAKHITPAIGMCSSAKDMAKWLRFHLRSGTNEHGVQVVEKSILQDTYQAEVVSSLMYMPEMERPNTPVTHTYDMYGMGWFVGYYRGQYGHIPLILANIIITRLDAIGIGPSQRFAL